MIRLHKIYRIKTGRIIPRKDARWYNSPFPARAIFPRRKLPISWRKTPRRTVRAARRNWWVWRFAFPPRKTAAMPSLKTVFGDEFQIPRRGIGFFRPKIGRKRGREASFRGRLRRAVPPKNWAYNARKGWKREYWYGGIPWGASPSKCREAVDRRSFPQYIPPFRGRSIKVRTDRECAFESPRFSGFRRINAETSLKRRNKNYRAASEFFLDFLIVAGATLRGHGFCFYLTAV